MKMVERKGTWQLELGPAPPYQPRLAQGYSSLAMLCGDCTPSGVLPAYKASICAFPSYWVAVGFREMRFFQGIARGRRLFEDRPNYDLEFTTFKI